jgi:hypothetical protein
MRWAFAAAPVLLMPFMALAQSAPPSARPAETVTHVETVAELAAVCDPARTGVPRLEAIAYCQGFLTSAGQYHTMLHPPGRRPLYCVPVPGPTIAESGIAFAAWARANPAYSREPALDGLLRWAQATFPCPPAATPARPQRAR